MPAAQCAPPDANAHCARHRACHCTHAHWHTTRNCSFGARQAVLRVARPLVGDVALARRQGRLPDVARGARLHAARHRGGRRRRAAPQEGREHRRRRPGGQRRGQPGGHPPPAREPLQDGGAHRAAAAAPLGDVPPPTFSRWLPPHPLPAGAPPADALRRREERRAAARRARRPGGGRARAAARAARGGGADGRGRQDRRRQVHVLGGGRPARRLHGRVAAQQGQSANSVVLQPATTACV